MADPSTISRLRGLILSAQELRTMTDWPDALIEDYLNLLDNLILLAGEIDDKASILKNTTIVTTTPYTPLSDDEELFVDTNAEPIIITLPPGIDGTSYRIINVGTSENNVIIIPNGSELLLGGNVSEYLIDGEVLILTFETNEGWY